MSLTFLTKDEEDTFNRYTKEQVYEAYLLEVVAKERLTREVNELNKQIAYIRFHANKAGK